MLVQIVYSKMFHSEVTKKLGQFIKILKLQYSH